MIDRRTIDRLRSRQSLWISPPPPLRCRVLRMTHSSGVDPIAHFEVLPDDAATPTSTTIIVVGGDDIARLRTAVGTNEMVAVDRWQETERRWESDHD